MIETPGGNTSNCLAIKIYFIKLVMTKKYIHCCKSSVLPKSFRWQGSLLFLLGLETTIWKTPHFRWIYGKLDQIYEKLRSHSFEVPTQGPIESVTYGPMDHHYQPKRCRFTGLKLKLHIKSMYFSISLVSLFILHEELKYLNCTLFIENNLHFMKNCIKPYYGKLRPLKSGFIENSFFWK